MQKTITYFEQPGRDNTSECLKITENTVKESGCKHIVVASTAGDTGLLFAEEFRDSNVNVVVVTHSHGFKEPNHLEMSMETRDRIHASGGKVYTGTMITHGLETALSKKSGGVYPTLLVAQTLRRFGEGLKVCCEIAMMASDAGFVPEGEEIVTVAGTGRGADSVAVIRSAASKRFLDLKVLEILAKPRG